MTTSDRPLTAAEYNRLVDARIVDRPELLHGQIVTGRYRLVLSLEQARDVRRLGAVTTPGMVKAFCLIHLALDGCGAGRAACAQLARSLDTLREDAQRRFRYPADRRTLYTPRVVVAVATELQTTARLPERDAGLSGVAMSERLLNAHNSPLYGRDPMLLGEELHRITFVLGAQGEPHGPPS